MNENKKETTHDNKHHIEEKLATEFDLVKNKDVYLDDNTYYSKKMYWWLCHNSHSWAMSLHDRRKGTNCPYCKLNFKPNTNLIWGP